MKKFLQVFLPLILGVATFLFWSQLAAQLVESIANGIFTLLFICLSIFGWLFYSVKSGIKKRVKVLQQVYATVFPVMIFVLFNPETNIAQGGGGCTQGQVWVIDEDAANAPDHLHLWSFDDYNNPTTTATDYGRMNYFHPTMMSIQDIGSSGDIEAMAIDETTGYLYFTAADDVPGGPGGQALYRYDVDDAMANIGNIVVDLIGHISSTGGSENMTFDPTTNRLYIVHYVGTTLNTDTNPDELAYIDLASLNPDPMVLTNITIVATISGMGESVGYGDGMDLDESGNLYIVDGNDDDLYRVDKSTGAILAIEDNNIPGGIDANADVETIMWDPVTDRLIGIDNVNHKFVHLTTGSDGANAILGTFLPGTPGLPDGSDAADFEGSAMYAECANVCEIIVGFATPSMCSNNEYSLNVIVTYSNSPGGNITVNTSNGGTITVAATTSPQTITLTGLAANGVLGIDVTAFFVNDNTCTDDLTNAYDAPAACVMCPNLPCGTTTAVKN